MLKNKVKDADFGKGAPKIIISVMGTDVDECLNVVEKGKAAGVECLEWRGDFNASHRDAVTIVKQGERLLLPA